MIFSTQKNFVEEGSGSAVFVLATEGNTPLAATQADMTPLQRYVMIEGFKKQNEEVENAQSGGGGGPRTNSRARPFGGGSGDTTTFVNVGEDGKK